MLVWRKADMVDVHTVFSDLSPVSAEEIEGSYGDWWKALPKVLEMLSIPGSRTDALVDESGTPLAIFGHFPSREAGNRVTWFVFSNTFVARGVAGTRACRKMVQGLETFYPSDTFHSMTTSGHHERSRWFSMLGYQYVGIRAGGLHHYVVLKSDKSSDLGHFDQYNPTNPRAS